MVRPGAMPPVVLIPVLGSKSVRGFAVARGRAPTVIHVRSKAQPVSAGPGFAGDRQT